MKSTINTIYCLVVIEIFMATRSDSKIPNGFEATSEVVLLPTTIMVETNDNTPNKYHDLECCEWTRGIDTLLFRYKQDREEITSLILNDPNKLIDTIWKSDGPLAIDNECRCQMGNGENRSPFACAQCKNLRRLIDFRLGGIERPFQIECGDAAGKNLVVASSEIIDPFLLWDEDSARRARVYVQQYHNATICGTPSINNLRCITGDSFTIRTLILWMIHRIFTEKGLPHVPLMHTAFICRGVGYSLYDLPTIGTLTALHSIEAYHALDPTTKINTIQRGPMTPRSMVSQSSIASVKSQHFAFTPLKNTITRTIIVQLLVTLLELSKINFSHGTPSIHAIIFNKDPVSYSYDGVHVAGPITLQITDLWNSSATFNDVHYFPKNIRSTMHLERGMFVPEISTKTVSMAHCYDVGAIDVTTPVVCPATLTTCPDANTYALCKPQSTTLYRLTNSTIDIYNAMRHIGFPLYVGSFDLYCFMVSLMCDKSFFDSVTQDDRLYRLWSMMWLIEDLPTVERMIRDVHDVEARGDTVPNNRVASNIAIDIIRGRWLRCDIVKYLWSLIKLGW